MLIEHFHSSEDASHVAHLGEVMASTTPRRRNGVTFAIGVDEDSYLTVPG